MTIIGAVHTSIGAWIAADSLHSHYQAGYGEAADKIFRFREQKLAWGWFGSSDQAVSGPRPSEEVGGLFE